VPEVVEAYVGQPGERLGGSAGGTNLPYLPARTYATSRTLIVPSVSRRTVKGNNAVVVIGVGRHGVGGDNTACRPSPASPHTRY
jgi:hypothetical protein